MQTITLNFGFNIITEVKETKDQNNNSSYDSGNSVRQYEKQYTDDAVILQSILEYSIGFGTEDYFKSRDLSKDYLLDNCKYYKKLYEGDKTNRGSRAESMNRKVVVLLNNLRDLELVESSPCEAKNHEPTEEYRYTSLGRLIGLLLSYKKNKNEVSEELYNHILDFYDSMEQSSAKFWSIFLRKCYKSNVFDKVIQSFIDLLENASDDKDLFIKQIKNFNPILSKESWNILNGSFADLKDKDPLKYEILFYNLKLILEMIHEGKSRYFEGFEKIRFLSRGESSFATLEGFCKSCSRFTSVSMPIIPYFNSYVNSDSNSRPYIKLKCLNTECTNGTLDFEFIDNVKIIQKGSDVLNKREKKFTVKVFESGINVGGTIFERSENGDFTIRSKRFQAILIFLLDNLDKFFKTREVQNIIIQEKKELFNNSSSNTSSGLAEDYYKQFIEYFNIFKFCELVESTKVSSDNNESVMVDAYKLSKLGRLVALVSKFQSAIDKDSVINEIYQELNLYIKDRSDSLSIFCNKYFQACKESKLFDIFAEFLIKYLLCKHNVNNQIDLFTKMIFLRYENDDFKNEKLYELWKNAMLSPGGENRKYFFNHIRTHINRLVEKEVHDFAEFEIIRYENRAEDNIVIIEATCKNCINEYVYLPVPVILYLPYLFYDRSDAQLYEDTKTYRCQKCNKHDFDFIIV